MEEKKVQNKREKEIHLNDIILKLVMWYKYLCSKWITIIGFGILGGVLGFAFTYLKKPVYVATSTFVLEEGDNGIGMGQYVGLASMVGIDLGSGGGLFQGDNILELYKSRSMIEKTLLSPLETDSSMLLIDLYMRFNKLKYNTKNKPELKAVNFHLKSGQVFSRLQDSILGTIVQDIAKNYLSVTKPDKKLSIIRVDVSAKNEVFAKTFNDQIVKNVNDFYVQTKTKKSLANVTILQQKTDSVSKAMNGAIYTAAAVVDATPNLNPIHQIQRTAPMQRSQFTAEMNKAVLGELVKNLEMSKMALLKETPLIQIIDQPVFPLEVNKLGEAMAMAIGAILFGLLSVIILIGKKIINTI